MYTVESIMTEWRVLCPMGNIYVDVGDDPEAGTRARRIARALNREAAMGEVREKAMKESEDWPRPGIFEAGARYVLEALDAAGKGSEHAQG